MKRMVTPEEVWASIKELTEAQNTSREEWAREFEKRQQERGREYKRVTRDLSATTQRYDHWRKENGTI